MSRNTNLITRVYCEGSDQSGQRHTEIRTFAVAIGHIGVIDRPKSYKQRLWAYWAYGRAGMSIGSTWDTGKLFFVTLVILSSVVCHIYTRCNTFQQKRNLSSPLSYLYYYHSICNERGSLSMNYCSSTTVHIISLI